MRNILSKHATLIPLALLALLSNLNSPLSTLFAQGTAFTYQGRLTAGANIANGNYDMRFYLRDTLTPPGNPVGNTNTIAPVAVSNGLFTVVLDFGANFPGADRWLEIGVRTNGAASYITLSPRQKLTPTPYAITASNLSGALPTSQLSGTLPASQLSGTLASAQLGGAYSGAVALNNAANSFSGNGAGLTSLNANNLSSGTVADARLSANVALLNRNPQTFTGQNIFNTSVGIGTASPAAQLHVKQGSGSGVTPGSAAIVGDAQTSTDGIWGGSGVANGIGVAGECDNGASASGVFGRSSSGYGVYGFGNFGVLGSGTSYGVYGSSGTYGVYGNGGTYGVYGSGTSYGGYFASASTGLYASGNPAILASGNVGIGTSAPTAPLHVKEGTGSGATPASAAIVADAQTNTNGIWGASGAFNGIGVIGVCNNGLYGVYGQGGANGVYGSGDYAGVRGTGNSTGVYGSSASGYGGFFTSGRTGIYAEGSPAIYTSGSVGINVTAAATLHVQGTTATAGDNTADFYNPSLGPNHSHIHWGTSGHWYIRSAANAGCVIMQEQNALAYVGIGTGTPAYKLDVNGTIRANNVSPSDARWKKNIAPLMRALETIEQLRGVRYDWRAVEYPKINFEPGPQIGLIAQEVKKILPEAVSQDRDGFYSIAYSKLIPVLVEGIKEQQGQLRAKETRVAALEKAHEEMRLELAAQKELTSRMQAEFTAFQKTVARLAAKSASTFAVNHGPAEAK